MLSLLTAKILKNMTLKIDCFRTFFSQCGLKAMDKDGVAFEIKPCAWRGGHKSRKKIQGKKRDSCHYGRLMALDSRSPLRSECEPTDVEYEDFGYSSILHTGPTPMSGPFFHRGANFRKTLAALSPSAGVPKWVGRYSSMLRKGSWILEGDTVSGPRTVFRKTSRNAGSSLVSVKNGRRPPRIACSK